MAEIFMAITSTKREKMRGADEVLAIAIVDGAGKTILDTVICPTRHYAWQGGSALSKVLPVIFDSTEGKTVICYNCADVLSFFAPNFFSQTRSAMQAYSALYSAIYHDEDGHYFELNHAAELTRFELIQTPYSALNAAQACHHIWKVGIPKLLQVEDDRRARLEQTKKPEIEKAAIFKANVIKCNGPIPTLDYSELGPVHFRAHQILAAGLENQPWVEVGKFRDQVFYTSVEKP